MLCSHWIYVVNRSAVTNVYKGGRHHCDKLPNIENNKRRLVVCEIYGYYQQK